MTNESSTDSDDVSIDEQVQQAQQFHAQLDQMKEWSLSTASELQTVADMVEDEDVEGVEGDPKELRQAAEVIRQIYGRISG